MRAQKVILVTGATGAQGGSVARRLLSGGQFAVRCLTRQPDSEPASRLAAAGAQIVRGDLEDPTSLRAALDGCCGAFGVTIWESFAREYRQGKHLVDAVASAGVEHFVFSTQASAKKMTNGALEVEAFESKARLEQYARNLRLPATYVHPAFFYENFLRYFPPSPEPDGSFSLGFPLGDVPLAAVAAEDIGAVVAALFSQPADHMDKVVGIVGDEKPAAVYAEIMSRVTGARITYRDTPRDEFLSSGIPGGADVANMFELCRRYMPSRRKEMEHSRALNPVMQSFETWAERNRDRLKSVLARGASAPV